MDHYFNSHPHEEDDGCQSVSETGLQEISTHILTKRMTDTVYLPDEYMGISTHILTKRMTVAHQETLQFKDISTHILTKRMT